MDYILEISTRHAVIKIRNPQKAMYTIGGNRDTVLVLDDMGIWNTVGHASRSGSAQIAVCDIEKAIESKRMYVHLSID